MTAIPLSGLLSAFGGGQALAVSRPGAVTGSDTLGNPISTPTALTRTCVVVPTPAKTLERLNLDREQDYRSFYSEEGLQPRDEITYAGETWVAFAHDDYAELGGLNWVIARRVE